MENQLVTKICRHCKIEKPAAEFYRDNTMPDGHKRKCAECEKAGLGKIREQKNIFIGFSQKERYEKCKEILLENLSTEWTPSVVFSRKLGFVTNSIHRMLINTRPHGRINKALVDLISEGKIEISKYSTTTGDLRTQLRKIVISDLPELPLKQESTDKLNVALESFLSEVQKQAISAVGHQLNTLKAENEQLKKENTELQLQLKNLTEKKENSLLKKYFNFSNT